MFNCYAVYLGSTVVGVFRTEIAAENFVGMMGFNGADVRGVYLDASPF